MLTLAPKRIRDTFAVQHSEPTTASFNTQRTRPSHEEISSKLWELDTKVHRRDVQQLHQTVSLTDNFNRYWTTILKVHYSEGLLFREVRVRVSKVSFRVWVRIRFRVTVSETSEQWTAILQPHATAAHHNCSRHTDCRQISVKTNRTIYIHVYTILTELFVLNPLTNMQLLNNSKAKLNYVAGVNSLLTRRQHTRGH